MATSAVVSDSGSSRRLLFAFIGLVVVAGGGFFLYTQYTGGSPDSTTAVVAEENPALTGASVHNQNLPPEAQAIVNELQILQKIRPLDTKFFEEPGFRALRETPSSIPRAEPPEGRVFRLEPPQ